MAGLTAPVGFRRRVAAGVLVALFLGCLLLLTACQSDTEQAELDEFKAYWTQVQRVVKRQNAQADKAESKADAESAALNSYGVYCTSMAKCYERAADGYASALPPAALKAAHARLVRETREAARVMDRVGDEIRAEIRDSDLDEMSQKWIDKQTKPSQKAVRSQIAAYDNWYDAALEEGRRLGITWTSD